MKKTIMAAAAAMAACANAELNVSTYGSFDVSSAYVLYGARINKEPCCWTYGEVNINADEWGSAGVSLWQNTDITCRRKDSMRRMNEWDWTAYYRNSFNLSEDWKIAGEVGHIWYKYHGLQNDAAKSVYKTMMEAYGRLELLNPYAVPHLFAAYDWQVTDGCFMIFGVKRDILMPFNITFTPDFTVGGGDDRYLSCLYPPWNGSDIKGGISYVQLSGKLAYWLSENIGVHAQIAYSVIANDAIRSGIEDDDSDYRKQFAWGTCGIDVSF